VVRVVCDDQVHSVFCLARLEFDLGHASDLDQSSNHVDRATGGLNLKQIDSSERKSVFLDSGVVVALFDLSVVAESETKVILDWGEFLVGHLDLTVRKAIDLVFNERIKPLLSQLIEECSLNHCASAVDQVEVENVTSSPRILVLAKRGLLNNAGLEAPVLWKLIQGAYRHVLIIVCRIYAWQWRLALRLSFFAQIDCIEVTNHVIVTAWQSDVCVHRKVVPLKVRIVVLDLAD
jgi:hypothetical protein